MFELNNGSSAAASLVGISRSDSQSAQPSVVQSSSSMFIHILIIITHTLIGFLIKWRSKSSICLLLAAWCRNLRVRGWQVIGVIVWEFALDWRWQLVNHFWETVVGLLDFGGDNDYASIDILRTEDLDIVDGRKLTKRGFIFWCHWEEPTSIWLSSNYRYYVSKFECLCFLLYNSSC